MRLRRPDNTDIVLMYKFIYIGFLAFQALVISFMISCIQEHHYWGALAFFGLGLGSYLSIIPLLMRWAREDQARKAIP
jgi:hypothetical protein